MVQGLILVSGFLLVCLLCVCILQYALSVKRRRQEDEAERCRDQRLVSFQEWNRKFGRHSVGDNSELHDIYRRYDV
jgi:signal transduction histidine kinase